MGEKSAQRLAFFFLSLSPEEVEGFSNELIRTRKAIRYCSQCYNIAISDLCHICADPSRDPGSLCVVADPRDIFSLEKAAVFKGHYHVLGGLISPLDGIHPELLRLRELVDRLKNKAFSEVILAINPTVEGDATILYLEKLLAPLQVKVSRLAYGLPMGADIEYTDELTLQKAFQGRVSTP